MYTLIAMALIGQTPVTEVAVIPTHIDDNAKAEIPDLFDDHVLTAVQGLSGVSAIGQDDINAMLGLEKQKELLGCDDVSCVAEIGGALGVDKLMVLKVARVGSKWAVTAKLMTTEPPSVEKRTSNFVEGGLEQLMEAMGWIVPEVFGREVAKPTGTSTIRMSEAEPEQEPELVPPTPYEISLRVTVYLGGAADPELSTATSSEIVRKELNLAPSFGWRYANPGPLELLLELTAGFGSHRVVRCERTGCSGINDPAFFWLEVMQLVRLPFYENGERYLLMSSDRVGIELGVGGHFMIGPETEAGFSARATLFGSWLTAGVQLAVGAETGVQLGPVFGVRFGF